jgi:hypothetical protein
MNESYKTPKLLAETIPLLAEELKQLLGDQGEPELAAQVPKLAILGRCRCGDDFCATFYVEPSLKKAYGPGHRNVALDPQRGMLILDVVDNKIVCLEVLYRDEVRRQLLVEFP